MTDIYELMKAVREHPDFLFGAIFTTDDLEGRDLMASFSPSNAEDSMVDAGWDCLNDKMLSTPEWEANQ